MPFAVLKKVYSCSSEDPNNPASNLLKNETEKKWKTLKNDDKIAYVVLELEKPELITGIDIGNEHSAFVEVLVNKVGNSLDEFKEILLTSSFMTPFESKNSTCTNRVRCFGKDRLLPPAAEKYDLIKFICTQPFNKYVQYGLSFVKIHVAETKEEKKNLVPDSFLKILPAQEGSNESLEKKKFIGKFKLLSSDSDSDNEKSASLFNRWKLSKTPEAENKLKTKLSTSAAAQIRDSSTSAGLKNESECRKTIKPLKRLSKCRGDNESEIKLIPDRNRSDLLFTEEDSKSNRKTEKQIEMDKQRLEKDRLGQSVKESKRNRDERNNSNLENGAQNKETVELKDVSTTSKFSFLFDNGDNNDTEGTRNKPSTSSTNSFSKKTSPRKRQSSSTAEETRPSKKRKSEPNFKPFKKLLDDVVLVISGIQNPDRANLRTKALEMGAKYKPDWEKGCTHLICAFTNTPKYNQVQKAKGKIVKRTWIEDCHKSKKRYPWRKYALDSDERDQSYSEDEILDVSLKPNNTKAEIDECKDTEKLNIDRNHKKQNTTDNNTSLSQKTRSSIDSNDVLDQYDLQYIETEACDKVDVISSGSDTEDELEKIRNLQRNQTSEETERKKQSDKNISCTKQNHKTVIDQAPSKNSNSTEEKTAGSSSPRKNTSKDDIYEVTTEEEEYTKTRNLEKNKNNKKFYEAKTFYLNPRMHSIDKIKLEQYITQYGGECTAFVTEANYIISKDKMDTSKFTGEIVSPLWIYECNDMECLIPTTRYLFS